MSKVNSDDYLPKCSVPPAQFRAKVLVDGSEYESKSTHPTKKEAEQAVAKIAYECIHKEIDARDISRIYKEPMLCKSVLYEFAVKRNLHRPIYNTRYTERPSSVYICHLVLGGKTYKGEFAGSKQMAKQVVAQAAIESLLGTLYQIIMSKNKSHPSMQTRMDTGSSEKMLPKCSGEKIPTIIDFFFFLTTIHVESHTHISCCFE
ncbi:double-stranded RNA-binding protein 4-like [Solanum tuberosum]|uniref:double-stranded RNA-binding protein 4-like n=1 Tax=Solanum tuberosum TaxID=4113 RepID=UPI00073A1457|nr:PREDICTED: double-stranded RNA-binding protein 4-like [Solanum tuberosum]